MQALFLGIAAGLSLFLLACGEPSEPIQGASDEENITGGTNQPTPAPEEKTPTPEPTPKAKAKKPGTVLWEFETGDDVFSSPAIGSDGTVYVGSNDQKLYAIKTDSKGLAKSPWPMRGQNPQHTGRVPKK